MLSLGNPGQVVTSKVLTGSKEALLSVHAQHVFFPECEYLATVVWPDGFIALHGGLLFSLTPGSKA